LNAERGLKDFDPIRIAHSDLNGDSLFLPSAPKEDVPIREGLCGKEGSARFSSHLEGHVGRHSRQHALRNLAEPNSCDEFVVLGIEAIDHAFDFLVPEELEADLGLEAGPDFHRRMLFERHGKVKLVQVCDIQDERLRRNILTGIGRNLRDPARDGRREEDSLVDLKEALALFYVLPFDHVELLDRDLLARASVVHFVGLNRPEPVHGLHNVPLDGMHDHLVAGDKKNPQSSEEPVFHGSELSLSGAFIGTRENLLRRPTQPATLPRMNTYASLSFALFASIALKAQAADSDTQAQIERSKAEIVSLAQSFSGQGDPDFSRQEALEPLIEELLALSPQPPVKERLEYLYGTWKQVWGPYDYRNDDRGVDPELGTDEIYQSVFEGGYYYNVSPLYKNGDRSQVRVGLLRGEYKLDEENPNALSVRFTRYPGVRGRPDASVNLWDLAPLAEAGELEDQISIVPTWIVRLFFRGGALNEIYTDHDLRLLYGSNDRVFKKAALYVMIRAN